MFLGMGFVFFAVPLLLVLYATSVAETKTFTIGSEEHPWEEWGTFEAIDHTSEPGWIQPVKTSKDVNILHQLYEEGRLYPFKEPIEPDYKPGDARIWTPNAPFQENRQLLVLADGRKDSLSFNYFNRLVNNNGVAIYIDLGTAYPIYLVKFYPLPSPEHEEFYMKAYELYANDGTPESIDEKGKPIYHLLNAVPANMDRVVADSSFGSQYIQYIKLRNSSPLPFELDQIEIRGEGYIREAMFTSKIFDLGNIANFGRLQWSALEEEGSQVRIHTRTGRDQTTLVYYQINDIGEYEELEGETDEATQRRWERLPDDAKGPVVDDTDNWTLWSAPYDSSGQLMAAKGPRRYVQIKVIMKSAFTTTRAMVDSVSFEYAQPTLARTLLGKISPNKGVGLGEPHIFTYTVMPTIEVGDKGFDTIQITTPTRASFRGIKVGDRVVPTEDVEAIEEERLLTVRLSREADRITSDEDTVEVEFDCTVLTFGTVFSGYALASWEEGLLGQKIELEDLADLTVLGAKNSLGRILSDVEVSPNPFTPNGDGVNDAATLAFKLLQMIGTAPLSVDLYDLSGTLVKRIFSDIAKSDAYRLLWDGTTEAGELVSPGLYLYQVSLDADERRYTKIGTIAVVY